MQTMLPFTCIICNIDKTPKHVIAKEHAEMGSERHDGDYRWGRGSMCNVCIRLLYVYHNLGGGCRKCSFVCQDLSDGLPETTWRCQRGFRGDGHRMSKKPNVMI